MNPLVREQVNAAMSEVKRAYVQGCVDYYDSMTPNLWQKAHDDLERALIGGDARLIKNQINIYKHTLLRLISEFLKRGINHEFDCK